MDRPDQMQTARAEPIRYTYEDYLAFPDDGRRHELIDGEHFVTPAPVRRHQKLVVRLTFALEGWLREHPVGEVYVAPLDVILSDIDVVEPDLLFVSNERAADTGPVDPRRAGPCDRDPLAEARDAWTKSRSAGCMSASVCASTGLWTARSTS